MIDKALRIRRYITTLAIVFALIVAGQLVQQRSLEHALREGALWAPLTAAIYVGTRLIRSRAGQSCTLCNDISQVRDRRAGSETKA